MENAAGRPEKGRPAAGQPLTPREADIVRLVGLGLGNKDIAERLGVSVTTVRTHLNRVYGKLRSVSRIELALLASQAAGSLIQGAGTSMSLGKRGSIS